MAATCTSSPATTSTAPSAGSLLRGGAVATVLAAAATMVVASAGQAVGISLAVSGAPIPPPDGPFAETKEQLGGFWVIRVPDLDAALAWAEKCAEACRGPIEVRPFDDMSQD